MAAKRATPGMRRRNLVEMEIGGFWGRAIASAMFWFPSCLEIRKLEIGFRSNSWRYRLNLALVPLLRPDEGRRAFGRDDSAEKPKGTGRSACATRHVYQGMRWITPARIRAG